MSDEQEFDTGTAYNVKKHIFEDFIMSVNVVFIPYHLTLGFWCFFRIIAM